MSNTACSVWSLVVYLYYGSEYGLWILLILLKLLWVPVINSWLILILCFLLIVAQLDSTLGGESFCYDLLLFDERVAILMTAYPLVISCISLLHVHSGKILIMFIFISTGFIIFLLTLISFMLFKV